MSRRHGFLLAAALSDKEPGVFDLVSPSARILFAIQLAAIDQTDRGEC
jgi:hypothetical protein